MSGRFVAPGFVDIHTHSDLSILVNRQAESVIRQGVTTEILGESSSVAPRKPDAGGGEIGGGALL